MPARTLAAIRAELATAKTGETALADYTSPSATNRLGALLDVVAFLIWVHEVIVYRVLTEVQTTASSNKPSTPAWYAERAKEYHDGYDFDERTLTYATVDEAAQIVKRSAAATTGAGIGQLKVAKLDNDAPAPLSAAELSRFTDYIKALTDFGTQINITSITGDAVTVNATIYYDGELDSQTVRDACVAAVAAYFAELASDANFDGRYYQSKLVDALQAVTGVVDVTIGSVVFVDANAVTTTSPRTLVLTAGYAQAPTTNLTMTIAQS